MLMEDVLKCKIRNIHGYRHLKSKKTATLSAGVVMVEGETNR